VRLRNEFVVDAPLEPTWAALLDVPRVARALPGAAVEREAVEGVHRGTMTVRLGAVTVEYEGTAALQDADEDDRVAAFRVQGREKRGQGTATATITSRLAPADGRTRVQVETDLQVTGRQAQLGHGLMQDVAGSVLERFADELARELRGEPAAEGGAAGGGEALDLGGAVAGALRERALLVGAGAAGGLAVGWLLWGRR
jgi:uncharacterized protein